MIDPVRRELLDVLAELAELNPNLRLGQTLTNAVFFFAEPHEQEPRNIDDDRLLIALKKQRDMERGRVRSEAA